jgi:hypothetical protein
LFKAYPQDPAGVEAYLNVEYLKIKKRAKIKGARVFFAD